MADRRGRLAEFDRREFLELSGATVGGGLLSVGTETAEENRVGETRFVEIGVEHELVPTHRDDRRLPFVHTDVPLGHYVDVDRRSVFLLEPAPDDVLSRFDGPATAHTPSGYTDLPGSILGTDTTWVITRTGRGFRPLEVLSVDSSFRFPPIDVGVSGDRVTVDVRESVVTGAVDLGEAGTITLGTTTLAVEAETTTGKRVDSAAVSDERRTIETETSEVTVTATPTIEIRNYGVMEVVDATDRPIP